MEAQVTLTVAFSSSALLGLVSHLDSLWGSGEFADQSSTVTHDHLTNFWYLWQCGQVPSPTGK